MNKYPAKMTRAWRIIKFMQEYLIVPEGDLRGQKFELIPFEKDFIIAVYDNPHGTSEAILSVAKKNGKTPLIAGLLLAHIAGPEAVENADIISGARTKEQAGLIHKYAAKMLRYSPELTKRTRVIAHLKKIVGLSKNVTYTAISADATNSQGISPVLSILDETGQVRGPFDEFVDAIENAQGAYKDSLRIHISTQAPNDVDLLSAKIDAQRANPNPRVVVHVYEAPDGCDMGDRDAWRAANPAMGHYLSEQKIEDAYNEAVNRPSFENEFRNYRLNQRVEAYNPFVSRSIWEANGANPGDKPVGEVYAGLDLSSRSDLTAFVAIDESLGIFPTFWVPKDGLAAKSKLEKVPYDVWEKQGFIQAFDGKAIQFKLVAKFLRRFFDENDVKKVGFDRYLFEFLVPWLEKEGFTPEEIERFVPFGQGTASMTAPISELEVKLLGGEFKHGNHPVMNMCCKNCKVIGTDDARKFDKKKQHGRIDGMSALANAIGVMPKVKEEPCVYNTVKIFVG